MYYSKPMIATWNTATRIVETKLLPLCIYAEVHGRRTELASGHARWGVTLLARARVNIGSHTLLRSYTISIFDSKEESNMAAVEVIFLDEFASVPSLSRPEDDDPDVIILETNNEPVTA